MTYHMVEEKRTTDQSIDFALSEDKILKYIALKLYIQNAPTGNITVSIKYGSEVLASQDTTLTAITPTTGNFHWGYIKFTLDKYVYLKSGLNYTINLSTTGYTYSDSNFFGWCITHEDDPNENTESFGYKLLGPAERDNII